MSRREKPCPLCNGGELDLLIRRNKIAVLQNRTFASAAQARAAGAGELVIMRCRNCGFIHNNAFDPQLVSYTIDYENEQANSPRFRAHLAVLAGYVADTITGAGPHSVVDIGCGQGRFLGILRDELSHLNVSGYGFDTAYRGPAQTPFANFYNSYFGAATAHLIPPGEIILLTRHVIEHVPDPVEFLVSIRTAIQSGWRARLFVETPCVEWIFKNHAVQDFFYEHCNYWTAATLEAAVSRAGFLVCGIRHVFDGQYLWLEAVPNGNGNQQANGLWSETLAMSYLAHESKMIAAWRDRVTAAAADGRVALWGAGAKGVTMAALIDPEHEILDCLIDINPHKHNQYTPVTAHPVVSVETAHLRGVRTALVMNRNYLAEISAILNDKKIAIRLIDELVAQA